MTESDILIGSAAKPRGASILLVEKAITGKAGFLKNAVAYSGTNVISQAAILVQGFVLRNLLAPQLMGVWNYVGVVKGFASPLSVGLLGGAIRELPILRGKGDDKSQQECRSTVFTYSLIESSVVACCIVIYTLTKKQNSFYSSNLPLYLSAALVIFAKIQESYLTFFQGAQLYVPLSRLLFVNALILAVLLPIGAATMGLWGVFAGAILAEGLKAAWMTLSARSFGISPSFGLKTRVLKRLASYSILLKVADYPMALFMMADVLWVTKFFDTKSLAIYALARSFFFASSEITVRFGTVFMTRTFEKHGEGTDRKEIATEMYKFIHCQLFLAIPMIYWLMFSFAPLLVRRVTPLYTDSICPMFILGCAAFFDMRNNNLFTLWLAKKRLSQYGKANVLSLGGMAISLSLFWWVVKDRSLSAVAIATVIGYAFNFGYLMTTVGREVLGGRRVISILFVTGLSVVWILAIVNYCAPLEHLQKSLIQDAVFALKKAVVMFVWISPIVAYGLKTSGAAMMMLKTVRDRRVKPQVPREVF